jgi:hypothetical protein
MCTRGQPRYTSQGPAGRGAASSVAEGDGEEEFPFGDENGKKMGANHTLQVVCQLYFRDPTVGNGQKGPVFCGKVAASMLRLIVLLTTVLNGDSTHEQLSSCRINSRQFALMSPAHSHLLGWCGCICNCFANSPYEGFLHLSAGW